MNTSHESHPMKCVACESGYVRDRVIAKDVTMKHNGKEYDLHIPDLQVGQCDSCGEVYYDNRADDQKQAALRERLRVLSPEQIVALREMWSLSPADVHRDTGITPEALCRWEKGRVIQTQAMNSILLAYLSDPVEFVES